MSQALDEAIELGGSLVELGARIRRLRLDAGLSQRDLAAPNLTPSYISLIESGRRRASPEVLAQIAERLELLDGALEETNEPIPEELVALALAHRGLAALARLAENDGKAFRHARSYIEARYGLRVTRGKR